jgi:hypothetical protein
MFCSLLGRARHPVSEAGVGGRCNPASVRDCLQSGDCWGGSILAAGKPRSGRVRRRSDLEDLRGSAGGFPLHLNAGQRVTSAAACCCVLADMRFGGTASSIAFSALLIWPTPICHERLNKSRQLGRLATESVCSPADCEALGFEVQCLLCAADIGCYDLPLLWYALRPEWPSGLLSAGR